MNLYLWIYCMELPNAALFAAAVTACFLFFKKRLGRFLWWKLLLAAALTLCLGVVLYTTVMNRSFSEDYQVYLRPLESYRQLLAGGNREILRSNFMNVLLFYPAGLLGASLLSEKLPVWCRVLLPFLLLTVLSIGIETLQYMRCIGQVETDDVLHNALGALLGSLCGLFPLRHKK